ncbi:MAG: AsmA-like C-terminal region-containing protein [Chthoniobacteraceae bacterium]
MRRFFLALFLLAGAALLGSGWYVYHRGFTRKWRVAVSEEFRKRGVELTLRKLTLNPFRGIIAKEVKVYDARDRKRVLAAVDEMRLVINWANLINRRAFLDALDLHDATLALPIDPKDFSGPKVEVGGMSGRLFLPPQQAYLSSFEAEIYGIRVTASGRILNPEVAGMKPPKPSASKRTREGIVRAVEELKALRYEGEPPVLDFRFSGDLARPETVFVEVRLWAEHARRGDWRLGGIYLDALYRDQRVAVRQFVANDAKGVLRLSGSYDVKAKSAEVQLRSNLDPQPALRAFVRVPELDEFVFYDPPEMELTVRGAFGDSPVLGVLGHIGTRRVGYRSVIFDSLGADVVWDGDRWGARNVRLAHRSGQITGDAMQLPGEFRARLRSTINPKTLAPLLTGKAAEWFTQVEFLDAPLVSAEVTGREFDPVRLSGNAALKLGRTSYRDVWAQSATATLRYADRRITVDPLHVVREEGVADGGLVFDLARDEVAVQKIRTSLHPQEIIPWIDPKLLRELAPYRFGKKPPNLFLDGVVHTRAGPTTQLRVDVDAPGGMDYTFLRRELHAPQIAARLDFDNARMKIENLSASLFGGRVRGSADVSLRREDQNHSADVRLENVDFAKLTKLYFGYDDSKGRLQARYGFSIRGDDARSMRGRGELTVTEGKVFAIPFLGPLSFILNGIVPGMGEAVADKGSASFSIADGVIETKDFLVEAPGFSMIGDGKLMYLDDKMNFDVRINAKGLPGVLLFPVSKLFEYTSTDALGKPTWRPKLVPRL